MIPIHTTAVTVECCVLYPCCVGVFVILAVMQGIRLFPSVFAITERRDMGLYEVSLSMSLLGFGMETMLANFHMCGIMLVLRAVFNMLVRKASPRRHMCCRCLMFNLSGPCEVLFLIPFMLTCSMMRFLSFLVLGLCPCVVCVVMGSSLVCL